MRRSFLSVLFLASLFVGVESCKKGDTGPAGPAGADGADGAPGAAGATGATGATGADGTKITTGTSDPTGSTGANGDFYFNTSTKTLFGPKANGTWPAGTSLAGPKGDTGATGATGVKGDTGATGANGADGTKFLSGAGVPTAATGNVGDYYFDTNTSTFYGPKAAAAPEWAANQFPLGYGGAARTYYLTRGLDVVTLVPQSKHISEIATASWGAAEIFSSYKVLENDLIRINQYPGWGDNREMIFQSVPGSGVYDVIPQDGLPGTWGPSPLNPGGNTASVFRVGAKFRYTQNFTNPTAEFTLTAEDIDRLTADNGAAFGYLTYAKAVPSTVALGQNLTFYRTKNVQISTGVDADGYRADYTAQTNIDLNTIPGLLNKIESYKQDGKVYLKFRYVSPATKAPYYQTGAGAQVGWTDITTYVYSYTVGGATYGPSGAYSTTTVPAFAGTFPLGGYNTNPFTVAHPDGGAILGAAGFTFTPYTNNTVTAAATPGEFRSGQIRLNWSISSGTNAAGTPTAFKFGPITLNNPNADLNVVGNSLNAPIGSLATGWNYNTTILTKPYWSDNTIPDIYYAAPASLTSNRPITGLGSINMVKYADGRPAADFTGIPLVQVQVYVVPGDVVKAAKAQGVNVNNAAALAQFAETYGK